MNKKEVKDFYDRICHCRNPAEIFASIRGAKPKEEMLENLKQEWRQLLLVYHPDKFASYDPLTRHMAEEISGTINEMYTEAVDVINNGCKPPKKEVRSPILTIETKNNVYDIYEHYIEGEYANIFKGTCGTDNVCIKIVHDPKDNDLLKNEMRIMKKLNHKSLPVFLDVFKTTDRTLGIAMKEIDGYDLTEVLERYPDGLPERHAAWVLDRLLSVAGFMHINNVLHGNIEPTNIMIRPRDHNSFLIDFLFSLDEPVESKKTLGIYSDLYSHPDVLKKKAPMPHHDLASLGRSIIYVMGGDVENLALPPGVTLSFKRFVLELAYGQVRDAWKRHAELRRLRKEILGHKGFIELPM
jgi:serine/threonine protein kinase